MLINSLNNQNLIKKCLANIECKVVDIVEKHNIVVRKGIAAYFDSSREEKRTLHTVGDGTFIVDGDKPDQKKMMRLKAAGRCLIHWYIRANFFLVPIHFTCQCIHCKSCGENKRQNL